MSKLINIRNNKTRINITVDKEKLEKAKTKLKHFGGKLSTLFNAYLSDFVESMNKEAKSTHEEMEKKIKELEERLKKIEEKRK